MNEWMMIKIVDGDDINDDDNDDDDYDDDNDGNDDDDDDIVSVPTFLFTHTT